MDYQQQILNQLKSKFGNKVLDVIPFPKPYFKNYENVKAIYLGCDPSNKHSKNLKYAFALESDLPIFNNFLKDHSSNLEAVDLTWGTVYVQNLCQNYFEDETSANIKIWKEAAKIWIPYLKEELKVFDKNIPVLLTSKYLFDVLVTGEWKKYKPIEFYNSSVKIPIPSESNLLTRTLIPFYRNRRKRDYHLSNPEWYEYRNQITKFIKD